MKIRAHIKLLTPYVHGSEEIELPDNASDDEKDKAALEWADSVVDVWWEDVG